MYYFFIWIYYSDLSYLDYIFWRLLVGVIMYINFKCLFINYYFSKDLDILEIFGNYCKIRFRIRCNNMFLIEVIEI